MKTLPTLITILLAADCQWGGLHAEDPVRDQSSNTAGNELEREVASIRRREAEDQMKQVTVRSGGAFTGWSMKVWSDGSVRFEPNTDLADWDFRIAGFPPGACDQDTILREIPTTENPPPGFDKDRHPSLAIRESSTEVWKRCYPKDPVIALQLMRRMIAKVPETGWDEARCALTQHSLVRAVSDTAADSSRLETLLTQAQLKAFREWRGESGEEIELISSIDSPEIGRIFGDDTFLRVHIRNTVTAQPKSRVRIAIIHECLGRAKVYPVNTTPYIPEERNYPAADMKDAFGELLQKADHRIRTADDARLAAGAYAAFIGVQTTGGLEVEKGAGGFVIGWKKQSDKSNPLAAEHQAKLPVSIRFRCDPEGRLLKAEPIPPKPADSATESPKDNGRPD